MASVVHSGIHASGACGAARRDAGRSGSGGRMARAALAAPLAAALMACEVRPGLALGARVEIECIAALEES